MDAIANHVSDSRTAPLAGLHGGVNEVWDKYGSCASGASAAMQTTLASGVETHCAHS